MTGVRDYSLEVEMNGVKIVIDSDVLRPVVRSIVVEVLMHIGNDGRLAYNEKEAADLLGVARHCLRDCRGRRVSHKTGGRLGKRQNRSGRYGTASGAESPAIFQS